MFLNNSFNILPWYDSLEKQSSKKWYAFGQSWPLLCPKGQILPFQFICEELEILSNIFAVDVNTNEITDLGVTPSVIQGSQPGSTYYIVKLASVAVPELPVGTYYLRFNTSLGYLYSEEIAIIDDSSECIKIQYWNEDTLNFASGEINFADDFKFEFYIRSTIGKPEYEFEEELTKRLGYKFIESQTSNKVYKFAFVAPEYICDAMRLIRLCDYVKLTTKFDSYNALSFAYEPKWQDQGDLAAVDVEFDTDCIIQKLESFNRRIKESFYNALLADIDEPVLFSTDTVAQYYTEFTTTSFINGKLIRQLESILPNELQSNFADLVLPIDNIADNKNTAKKVSLPDLMSLAASSDISKLFKGHFDANGNLQWIEALAHLGVNGGVTMFIDNGTISLPQLYAGLPIDGNTLIRDKNGVLMINPDIELGGAGGSVGKVKWEDVVGRPTLLSSFTDDVVSGKYLPLSGGAMNANSYIAWNSGAEGNDVDDWDATITKNGISILSSKTSNSNAPSQYSTALHVKGRYGFQLASVGGADAKFFMRNIASKSDWKQLIHSGNIGSQSVASAGKLTTARTIWGQSFDGAGNVDGDFTQKKLGSYGGAYGDNSFYIYNRATSDVQERAGVLRWAFNGISEFKRLDILGENIGTTTAIASFLDNGNVGIGVTSPSYKLDVNGITQSTALKTNSLCFECDSLGNTSGRNGEINRYGGALHLQYATNTDVTLCFGGGNVGIGTTSPLAKLHIDGGILATGGIATNDSVTINGIKLFKSQDGVLYIDGNLAIKGGVTMFATDSATIPNIMDSISVDGITIKKTAEGALYVDGDISGGIKEVYWSDINNKPTFASVATSGKYSDLSGKPTLLSSFTDDVVSGKYLPLSGGTLRGGASISWGNANDGLTDTSDWDIKTDGLRILSSITSGSNAPVQYATGLHVVGRYGFQIACEATSSNFYMRNIRDGVNNWCKLWHAGNDGSGSGLDADMLDGKQPSELNVASATKLQTSRTIWGQSFDGTANVDGKLKLTSWDSDGLALRFENSSANIAMISMHSYAGNAFELGQNKDRFVVSHNVYGDILNVHNGNVGVGTASPNAKLHVNGVLRLAENVPHILRLHSTNNYDMGFVAGTTGNECLAFIANNAETSFMFVQGGTALKSWSADTWKSQTPALHIKNNSLYVNALIADGVTPAYNFLVNGVAKAKSLYADSYVWLAPNSEAIYINATAIAWHNSSNAWTDTLIIFDKVSVTLNKNTTVQGNLLATGGITMYSDLRKKTKLADVELTLKQVAEAPLIQHYYNSDNNKTTHVGSIAQYWYDLNDWFCKEDSEGFLTMEIQNAALASAISIARELMRYETKTDKKIRLLKKRIGELEGEIENLKNK